MPFQEVKNEDQKSKKDALVNKKFALKKERTSKSKQKVLLSHFAHSYLVRETTEEVGGRFERGRSSGVSLYEDEKRTL